MSRLRRVRSGELIALAGAIAVIVSLIVPWYSTAASDGGGGLDAWSTFGAGVVLLIIGCAAALLLVMANLFERSPALPIAAAVWSTILGLAAVVAALVRLLERPDGASGLEAGAWLALGGAVAIVVGGWLSMRDERQDLYEPAEAEQRHIESPR